MNSSRTNAIIDVLRDKVSQNETGKRIENFFTLTHSWTSYRYYPILTVLLNRTHIQINQKPSQIDKAIDDPYWIFPITILTPNNSMSDDVYWITEKSLIITRNEESESWILIKPTIAGINY